METFERRNQIWEKLRVRRFDTVGNLSMEFNVSERTIRRDIQALILQKPIYTLAGRYGGIFVMDESANIKYFDKDEQSVIEQLILLVETEKLDFPTEKIGILRRILSTYTKPERHNK